LNPEKYFIALLSGYIYTFLFVFSLWFLPELEVVTTRVQSAIVVCRNSIDGSISVFQPSGFNSESVLQKVDVAQGFKDGQRMILGVS
jgi:hypothetical protein